MGIEKAIKVAVENKLERLLKEDLQKLLDKVVDEALKQTKQEIGVKLIPVDKDTFKFEFYRRDVIDDKEFTEQDAKKFMDENKELFEKLAKDGD